jgi:NUMOD4 motif./HNH endonuclease.
MEYKKIKHYYIIKDMYMISEYGDIINIKTGEKKSVRKNKRGYLIVDLQVIKNNKSKTKTFYIHRLVLRTFIGKNLLKKKKTVNHKDGNKLNNHYTNLEWATYKEQMGHAISHNLHNSILGENNHTAIYSNKLIKNIKEMMNNGFTNKEIKKKLDLKKCKSTTNLLYNLRHNNKWKSI